MLVFISDLHLTDGSTCETIGQDAFGLFVEDLEWMVTQACHRRDEQGVQSFVPLERVDLILLGDIFDVLRSDTWQESNPRIRPWTPELASGAERSAAHERLAQTVTAITREIVRSNNGYIAGEPPPKPGRGLEALRELAANGIEIDAHHVPAGTHIDPDHRIPVSIWYMPGNHDWFYNVGLPAYDAARQLMVDAFGLAHPANVLFPHTIDEAPERLHALLRAHKVHAQHGDLYDGENIQLELKVHDDRPGLGRRAHSSIGDMIVIELLNGLPAEIKRELGAIHDPLASDPAFFHALEELDNVRPMLAIPQWLSSLLLRYETGDPSNAAREQARRDAVSRAVGKRLTALTSDPFAGRLDRPFKWDTIDTLQLAQRLNRFVSIEQLAEISSKAQRRGRPESYREHAITCLDTLGRHAGVAEFIVFGHTHHPEVVALDIDATRGWVYINTGTWRRVHERCVAAGERIEFLSFHVMSFAAIYRDGERRGRPYETWTGTLGSRPVPRTPAKP